MLVFDLHVKKDGNALSVITSYMFESTMLSLSLATKNSGTLILEESIGSLESIHGNPNEISFSNNMASYMEIPSIREGDYELQILVRKSLFLPTS